MWSGSQRGRFQGYLASVYMCASTLGPVAGGWLTQHFGWSSIFWINLPLGAAAIGMALRLPRRPAADARLRFDFLGVVLFALFIGPALLALEQAQHFDVAAVPTILVLAAIATIALILLVQQERRAAAPLLPIALLRQSAIWRTDAMAACVGATLVSLITFLPIYMEVVRGTGPSETGVLLLPLTAFIALGSLFTGRLVSKTGRSAIFPSCGLPIVVTALVVQVTVQMLAGAKQLGAAAASVQFSRSIGSAFGTALVGAVLFAMLAATDLDTAHLFARLVEQGPSALAGLSPARIVTVQAEIASAFRAAFLTIAGFTVIATALAWTVPVRRIVG
ncbi:MAG TPA: MFS transporter [Acetobacteraceae bacterium]|jgi:predicted MFS family arabinose efflux permease